MNFRMVHNVAQLSSSEQQAFIDGFKQHFADKLRAARGDAQRVQHAIAGYRACGEKVGFSGAELKKMFCTEMLNVLALAGYAAAEAETAAAFFDEDPDGPMTAAGT
jgi:hypothetical protein